jgi:hypothetical protein
MSVRAPQSFYQSRSPESGLNILEYELAAERAAALGRHGKKLEACLAKLRQWDADPGQTDEAGRLDLVYDAADAVWSLFIQRELVGLRDNRDLIRRYEIPKDVIAKVGIVRRR